MPFDISIFKTKMHELMCHLQGVNDDVMRHLSHKQVRFSVVIRN